MTPTAYTVVAQRCGGNKQKQRGSRHEEICKIYGAGRDAGAAGTDFLLNTVQSGKAKAITPQWFSTTNLNVNVRKWAHVYIYCALGVSMAVTVHLWTVSLALWQRALLSAALCMLCAAGDELHQFFVPGRAMLLSDVGIDAMGFLPCIAAVFLCIRVYRGCRK